MNYTESHKTLNNILKTEAQKICLPELGIALSQFKFTSVFSSINAQPEYESKFSTSVALIEEDQVPENLHFDYPVIYPVEVQNFDKAIVLLHGLNERNWNKYLPWAYRLSHLLQRPVIMFPIAFHMNRAPAQWSNPRLMSTLLPKTRMLNHRNQSSTFANIALSLRLSHKPERFFTSGCQSLHDIMELVSHLKSGEHPLIKQNSKIDFFAYSIGAFLAQVMMLTYGDSILGDSRVFLFCGGIPFNRMNGVSKLIMDEEAYIKLRFYYLRTFKREIERQDSRAEWIKSQPWGLAFKAMISSFNFSQWKADAFKRMGDRIHAIGLANDQVIPATYISELLAPEQMEILDFPYEYTHENPFPLQSDAKLVNKAFDALFEKVKSFLE